MSTVTLHGRPAPRGPIQRQRNSGLALPVAVLLVLVAVALGYVAYVLWPRWPQTPVEPNAPALPITVAGTTFNVPPGAIRIPMQRQAGAQERLDLAFLWPTLAPPAGSAVPAVPIKGMPRPKPLERIFVTIAATRDGLSPEERVSIIYPRYAESGPASGPGGLALLPFRLGTPYHGEDLIYDDVAPTSFLVRCSRGTGPVPGICLYAKRVGMADLTMRFPRDWLNDWRSVNDGIERLIAKLRPPGG